jgi:hypothetical protein
MSNTLALQPIFQLKATFSAGFLDMLNFSVNWICTCHATINNISIATNYGTLLI